MDSVAATEIGLSGLSALVTFSVTYGTMRSRLNQMEKDLNRLEDAQEKYVTMQHFETVRQDILERLNLILAFLSK